MTTPVSVDYELRTFVHQRTNKSLVDTIEVRVERHYERPAHYHFKNGGYMNTEYYLEWLKDDGTVETFKTDSDEMVTCVLCQKTIGRLYRGVVVEKHVGKWED